MRAILHIGAEKTGTTALQSFVAANRAALMARGFRYASFPGEETHWRLPAYAQDDAHFDDLRLYNGVHDAATLSQFRASVEAGLAAEATDWPDHVFLFSSEHCQSRLIDRPAIERLQGLLAPVFNEIRIALYLRRQDRLAVSRYSSVVKHGGGGDVFDQDGVDPVYWDFDRTLDLWAGVFGKEMVRVEVAEPDRLLGGSVVSDFVATFALGVEAAEPPRRNPSLDPLALEALRRLNLRLPTHLDGAPNPARGAITEALETTMPGPGARPRRAMAEAFMARHTDSNERLRARWFPDRPQLFDADFGAYPDASPAPHGFDDALRVAEALWRAAQTERAELIAAIDWRDGVIRDQEARLAERTALLEAIAWKDKVIAELEARLRAGTADEASEKKR
ncbi:MAG: hypothetical protein AAGE90_08525 [Pseudomonadota bacterium]